MDSGTQPLMLGKAPIDDLNLHKGILEARLFTINTLIGRSKKAMEITTQLLLIKFKPNDVIDAASIKTKAIVIQAESFVVLVGAIVLYSMGFSLE